MEDFDTTLRTHTYNYLQKHENELEKKRVLNTYFDCYCVNFSINKNVERDNYWHRGQTLFRKTTTFNNLDFLQKCSVCGLDQIFSCLITTYKPFITYLTKCFIESGMNYVEYDETTFNHYFSYDNMQQMFLSGGIIFHWLRVYVQKRLNFESYELCITPMLLNRDFCHLMWCHHEPYVEFVKDFHLKKVRLIVLYEKINDGYVDDNLFERVLADEYLVKNIVGFL